MSEVPLQFDIGDRLPSVKTAMHLDSNPGNYAVASAGHAGGSVVFEGGGGGPGTAKNALGGQL